MRADHDDQVKTLRPLVVGQAEGFAELTFDSGAAYGVADPTRHRKSQAIERQIVGATANHDRPERLAEIGAEDRAVSLVTGKSNATRIALAAARVGCFGRCGRDLIFVLVGAVTHNLFCKSADSVSRSFMRV